MENRESQVPGTGCWRLNGRVRVVGRSGFSGMARAPFSATMGAYRAARAADCAWASVQSREFRDLGRVEGWMCSATPVLR